MVEISRHEAPTRENKERKISYLEAGPQDGPLLIFVHGWPATADVWKPQIITFAGLGFRVVAPDLPGFGSSYKSEDRKDFTLKAVNASLLGLLKHLGREQATWIGHDWGAVVVWSFLAHHPENVIGVANMVIPYRTIEYGIDEGLVKYADRDVYPEDEYPDAQWDYMRFYQDEKNFDKCIKDYESDIPNFFRAVYRKGNPDEKGKPAFTASITKNNGWFGEETKPPQVPLDTDVLDEERHKKLADAFEKGGFRAPTLYYLNNGENAEYTEDWSINEGVTSLPVLFLGAKYDTVCVTQGTQLAEVMRNFCRKYTEVNIEAGHWIAQEKPQEVNAAITKWIATALPASAWPYNKTSPLQTTF